MQIAPTRSAAFGLTPSKKPTGQRNSNNPFFSSDPVCSRSIHLSLPLIWVNCCKEPFGGIDLGRSLKYVQQIIIREILKLTVVWSSFDQALMRVCLNPTQNYGTAMATSSPHIKTVKKTHTVNSNFKAYTPLHISTCNGNDTVFLYFYSLQWHFSS